MSYIITKPPTESSLILYDPFHGCVFPVLCHKILQQRQLSSNQKESLDHLNSSTSKFSNIV